MCTCTNPGIYDDRICQLDTRDDAREDNRRGLLHFLIPAPLCLGRCSMAMVMIAVMGSSAVPGSSRTLVAIAAAIAARQQLREIDFGGTKLRRCSGVLAPLQKSLCFLFSPASFFLAPHFVHKSQHGIGSEQACLRRDLITMAHFLTPL